MPQLEAMACGAPLVVSELPVFREIAGPAAVYADPADVASMAGAIAAVVDDPARAARMSRTGRERAACFSWDRCAQRVHEEARRRLGLGYPTLPEESHSTVLRKA
jgi:alpha-1,3-rhamnosyl/mannosyltransferase